MVCWVLPVEDVGLGVELVELVVLELDVVDGVEVLPALVLLELELGAAPRAGVACADLSWANTIEALRRLALVARPSLPGGAPPGSGTGAPGSLGSVVVTPGWLGPRNA